jgi:hypothetical protein
MPPFFLMSRSATGECIADRLGHSSILIFTHKVNLGRLLLWVCYKNRTRASGYPRSYLNFPQQRSKMPDMSERLMEVFAVIVTIILGTGLSEIVIQSWAR